MCVQGGDTALMKAACTNPLHTPSAHKGYSEMCTQLLTAKAQLDIQDKVRG